MTPETAPDPVPATAATVEVPLSLLYRIDSITSLVYHRERRGGISDESAAELLAVSGAVRAITNQAEGKRNA